LEHPNIVPVHELGLNHAGKVYFTMKLVRGESLEDIINRIADGSFDTENAERETDDAEESLGLGRTPQQEAQRRQQNLQRSQRREKYTLSHLLQIFLKICDAIAFAHSKGVIHRDLKPENVMVGRFGEVLVMDWGLAKVRGRTDLAAEDLVATIRTEGQPGKPFDTENAERETEDAEGSSSTVEESQEEDQRNQKKLQRSQARRTPARTMEGDVLGTPSYMPPEQAAGRVDDVDARSDVFSLGSILYKILTHEAPYSGATAAEVVRKAVRAEYLAPRVKSPWLGIPAELQSICLKAMRLKKEERYGSVEALIGDVRAFQDHRPVRAHRYGLPARFVRFVRRHPAGSLAGGVAVVLLSIGAAVTGMLLSYAETLAAREVAAKAQADAAAVRAAKESDRADEAEVKKGIALGRARTAEDMLEKGRKVAAVLKAAETELGEVHRALKNASLSPEAATSLPAAWEKHASRIEAHEATVPEDPASRATWYAAKGWLNTIAGRPEIGKDLFQQARTEDPDVAAGWLFEAMTCLAEYYRSQPSAKATIHEEGLVLKVVPGETETMRGARKRFEILLDEARKDRVWGLTAAEQFLEALGGARAFQALDLAGAEKGFSKALAIPEAVWMREEIWMMRARIRSLAGDVEGGLTDVRNAIEVLPDALALRVDLGLLEYQKAGAEAKAGRDPFVWYGRAALSISRVVEKGSKDASLVARNLRSIVYLSWGTAAVEEGKDPIPAFGKSLEDLTVLIDAFHEDPELLRMAGMTHTRLGAALHNAGQASTGNFRQALAFFEAAVEKGAKEIQILDGRGAAALHLATA
ncbi:MAG: serine/threonine-protein kinase, partial [Planctomycetota bacterium]